MTFRLERKPQPPRGGVGKLRISGKEFVRAGVPKEHIVLGFRSPEMRQHTEFAMREKNEYCC